MTKKNKNINPYAIHHKNERPRGKKPKHGSKIKPIISQKKHGKMNTDEQPEREVTDGSVKVVIFVGKIMAIFGIFYALAWALKLI